MTKTGRKMQIQRECLHFRNNKIRLLNVIKCDKEINKKVNKVYITQVHMKGHQVGSEAG